MQQNFQNGESEKILFKFDIIIFKNFLPPKKPKQVTQIIYGI